MHKRLNLYLAASEGFHLCKLCGHGFRKQASLFGLTFISAHRPLCLALPSSLHVGLSAWLYVTLVLAKHVHHTTVLQP